MPTKHLHSKMFEKQGLLMSVIDSDEVVYTFRAYKQPLRYKNKIYLSGIRTELGYDGMHKYLLISPPVYDFSLIDNENIYLKCGNEKYNLNHTELVYLGKKPLYVWSILSKI